MTDIVLDMAGPGARMALAAAARAEAAASVVKIGANTSVGEGGIPGGATGVSNAAMGTTALGQLTTGNLNTGMGDQALAALTSGGDNTAVGAGAERMNPAGSRNTSLGSNTGVARTSGNDNLTAGFAAMGAVVAGGDHNVALGRQALFGYAGSYGTATGSLALRDAVGANNTATGFSAGLGVTSGSNGTYIGYRAGDVGQEPDAHNVIVIGANAVATRSNQIVLGTAAQDEVVLFGATLFRKAGQSSCFVGNAGNMTATGGANVVMGHTAGQALTIADSNTIIGYEAGYNLTSGGNNVAVGRGALLSATLGRDCTAVGAGALTKMVDGVGTTAVGRYALERLVDGGNNTAVGDAAGRNLAGEQNCLMGYGTMRYGYANSFSVVIGQGALYNAGRAPGPLPEDDGNPGPIVKTNGVPTGPGAPSNYNAVVGWLAFENTSGGGHTGLGANAGRTLTGGSDMICIGRNAGFGAGQKLDATGSVVIGVGAVCTRSNEIVIGKAADTHITLAGVTLTKAQFQALVALVS